MYQVCFPTQIQTNEHRFVHFKLVSFVTLMSFLPVRLLELDGFIIWTLKNFICFIWFVWTLAHEKTQKDQFSFESIKILDL